MKKLMEKMRIMLNLLSVLIIKTKFKGYQIQNSHLEY